VLFVIAELLVVIVTVMIIRLLTAVDNLCCLDGILFDIFAHRTLV